MIINAFSEGMRVGSHEDHFFDYADKVQCKCTNRAYICAYICVYVMATSHQVPVLTPIPPTHTRTPAH